jgi:hypothetical protein
MNAAKRNRIPSYDWAESIAEMAAMGKVAAAEFYEVTSRLSDYYARRYPSPGPAPRSKLYSFVASGWGSALRVRRGKETEKDFRRLMADWLPVLRASRSHRRTKHA